MSAPAHKNLKNPPGQIINKIDGTLREYIERKEPSKKKLTFEEWWLDAQHTIEFEKWPEKAIWLAAQENK